MPIISSDDFETRLGTIQTWVETEKDGIIQQQNEFKVTTIGHSISLQPFDLKQVWAPGTMEYESARGWRWFIHKTNDQKERLSIFCKLVNPSNDEEWGITSGEHLDAIEIENKTYHLHIGTEDGEMMHYRAEVSDWMPARFKAEVNFYKSFTEYIDFGFKTSVPELEEGEKIYFHFIIAINPIKPSKDYPNERDASTWFAVDQFKKYLDKKLINEAG